MDKKWKRRVGRLDIQTPPPKLKKTRYIDDNGIIRVTIHDGTFSPTPPTPPAPTESPMYFEAVEANSTVTMMSTLETAPNLEYSTDGVTWQEWQHTTAEGVHNFDTLTLTAVGDKVYFRGDNPDGLAFMQEGAREPNFSIFVLTGAINGGGNIMSLLDADMGLTEVPQFGLMGLFADNTGQGQALLTPPSMETITTIGDRGCEGMYFRCTYLTAAADMPQLTTIGDSGCNNMYSYCTSLIAAADMPQLTTIGYGGCSTMYLACTSLIAAADMPQLTTIGDNGCAYMYRACTSLTAAADMPQLTAIDDRGCIGMYLDDTFDMSDDGITLNFDFPTPPITTTGLSQETYATAYDVANWMGNTNGFTNP